MRELYASYRTILEIRFNWQALKSLCVGIMHQNLRIGTFNLLHIMIKLIANYNFMKFISKCFIESHKLMLFGNFEVHATIVIIPRCVVMKIGCFVGYKLSETSYVAWYYY